jgi:hypothetical protein
MLQWGFLAGAATRQEVTHVENDVIGGLLKEVSHHEDGSWTAQVTAVPLLLHTGKAGTTSVPGAAASLRCAPVELRKSIVWGVGNSGVSAANNNSQLPCPVSGHTASSLVHQGRGHEEKRRRWQGQAAAVREFKLMHAEVARQERVVQLRMWHITGCWLQRSALAGQGGVKALVVLVCIVCGACSWLDVVSCANAVPHLQVFLKDSLIMLLSAAHITSVAPGGHVWLQVPTKNEISQIHCCWR